MADYEQPGTAAEPHPDDKPTEVEASLTDWNQPDESGVRGEDSPNLVPFFLSAGDAGKKWLAETLAKQACDDTMSGWDDSEDFRQNRARINRLYTGFLRKKTFPYDGCANIHIPVMLENLQRLCANVYAELFQDREMVFGVKATGPDDYETAEILTLHANWRLKNELTDFPGQMDTALAEFFLAGTVIAYSWRDRKANRNCHDVLSCDDVVVPYAHKAVKVDMSDVPWKTRIVRKYRHELEDLKEDGEWSQVDLVLKNDPPPIDFMTTTTREQGEQREGVHSPEKGRARPYVFFQYHGWLRMPGETRQRPICVTVSADHKVVTQFFIREEPHWKDLLRYDQQTAELGQYTADMESFSAAQQEYATLQGALDPMTGQPMAPPAPPTPPPQPEWLQMDEAGMPQPPAPPKRVPLEMFSIGKCSYNPDGMLGLGYGSVLGPFNEMADEATNRFYDQATASNAKVLLTKGNVLPGNTALIPGKVIPLTTVDDDIRKAIYEHGPGPANAQLFDFARWGMEAAESAVAAPSVLSGQPGKSGETFRGLATRAEKATKQLSTSASKFVSFLEQIFKNDAKLLANFLEDEELVQVNDHLADYRKFTLEEGPPGPPDPMTGQPTPGIQRPKQQIRVTRDMYRRNYEVTFTADLAFTSKAEKIAQADEVLAMVNQVFPPIPPGQPIPDPAAAIRHAAMAEALRVRGKQDLIPLLGPPPPPPPQPMGTPTMPPPPPPGMAPPGEPPGMPPGPGPQPDAGMPPS